MPLFYPMHGFPARIETSAHSWHHSSHNQKLPWKNEKSLTKSVWLMDGGQIRNTWSTHVTTPPTLGKIARKFRENVVCFPKFSPILRKKLENLENIQNFPMIFPSASEFCSYRWHLSVFFLDLPFPLISIYIFYHFSEKLRKLQMFLETKIHDFNEPFLPFKWEKTIIWIIIEK